THEPVRNVPTHSPEIIPDDPRLIGVNIRYRIGQRTRSNITRRPFVLAVELVVNADIGGIVDVPFEVSQHEVFAMVDIGQTIFTALAQHVRIHLKAARDPALHAKADGAIASASKSPPL